MKTLLASFPLLLALAATGCDDGGCLTSADCLTGRVCTEGVCVDPALRDPKGGAPHVTKDEPGGGGGSSCSCHCECSYCSASTTRTCTGGAGCSSCSSVCKDTCSSNPQCGGFESGSGTCQ
jgi:hypothetical protein